MIPSSFPSHRSALEDPDLRACIDSLTRAPLLSAAEEQRVAFEIDDVRRRLFAALARCPAAALELLRQAREGGTHEPQARRLSTSVCERVRTSFSTASQLSLDGGPAERIEALRELAGEALDAVDLRAFEVAPAVAAAREILRHPHPAAALEGREAYAARVSRIEGLHADYAQAVGALALRNTRLALSIARRYEHRGLPLADLVQEGILGLLKAARRFEPRRGLRFSTSATWWIRQAVLRALDEKSRLVRIPGRALEALGRVRAARTALEQRLGREPSVDELAAESGVGFEKTRHSLTLLSAPLSLHGPAHPGEARDLGETLADGASPSPSAAMGDARLREDLGWAMQPLTARERQVMARRFGIGGAEPGTLDEIGRAIGLTRERVRQIETHALAKLRDRLRRLGWGGDASRA